MRVHLTYLPWTLLAAAAVLLAFTPLRDSDTFFYLATAREILKMAAFPVTDPFVFKTLPLEVRHEWLGYFVWYGAWLVMGYAGLTVAKLAVFSGIVGPSVARLWRSEGWTSSWYFATWLIGLLAFSLRFNERTSAFSELFLVLALWLMVRDLDGNERAKWWLIPLSLLWVNTHASFPLIAIFGGWWALTSWPWSGRRWLTLALCAGIWPLNPAGIDGMFFPFHVVFGGQSDYLIGFISESAPTFSASKRGYYEIWCLAVFLVLMLILGGRAAIRSPDQRSLFLFGAQLALTIQAFLAVRYISQSVAGILFVSAALAPALTATRSNSASPSIWRLAGHTLAAIVLIATIVTGRLPRDNVMQRFGTGPDDRVFPTETLRALRALPVRGPTFNSFFFGGYLAWELEGRRKIWIHGFVIDPDTTGEYTFLGHGLPVIDHVTKKYQFDSALIQKIELYLPVYEALRQHPEWSLAVEDPVAWLFVRAPTPTTLK